MTKPADRGPSGFVRLGMLVSALFLLFGGPAHAKSVLPVGHFPNITHIQALVAQLVAARQGLVRAAPRSRRDGALVRLQRRTQRYGGDLRRYDRLTYVGPNPAINAYARSRGEEVRIIAGAVNGGAALIVQPDLQLKTAADFRGRKIATPQLGNTQDVAARAWLAAGGLKITPTGGDAQVLPTATPDQLALFKTKQLDAVWTVEPWVSRLETEAGGKVLLEEREAITTVLVSSS